MDLMTEWKANGRCWSDWTWQVRKSLKSLRDFELHFHLTEEERAGFGAAEFQIRTTPYYAALALERGDRPMDPIRRMLMPTGAELATNQYQSELDPLGERQTQNHPTARIVHRYPDRALFLVTDFCSMYCRYCTRKHFTGGEESFANAQDYQSALSYLRRATGIREVILSGGDPLTLSDSILERVLSDIRQIRHIEIIRVGTRMPVVNPMRVTDELTSLFRKFKPVFVMTHFNHPYELTVEAGIGLERLVDSGVPVMNQTVLLNGVNNSAAVLHALSRQLLKHRVKPYYLFQCDPSRGSDHFRTSVEQSEQIVRELWGTMSGLAMPTFSLDIPSGGGKTTLAPDFEIDRKLRNDGSSQRVYQGWDGVRADYVSPPLQKMLTPLDEDQFEAEWQAVRSAKRSQATSENPGSSAEGVSVPAFAD